MSPHLPGRTELTETAQYQLIGGLRDAIETKEKALCALLNIEETEILDALINKGWKTDCLSGWA